MVVAFAASITCRGHCHVPSQAMKLVQVSCPSTTQGLPSHSEGGHAAAAGVSSLLLL